MGGLLAQQLAASVPCAALVCVASAPPWMLTAQVRTIPYLAPLMPAILTGRPLYPRAEVFKNIAIQDLTEADQRVLLPTFVAESGRAYRSMIFGLARLPGPSFQGPVLCISGGQDRIISNRISAAIARLYRARHEVFANRGHWLIALSAEREVASAIERWLRENSLGG
jgi:pimeloyl-ACP methyl ester carboxylesterase